MKRACFAVSLCLLLGVVACGDDDSPSEPPTPSSYEAAADFWNVLVADGTIDTRLNFFRDSPDKPYGTNIIPFGGSTNNKVDLAEASSSVVLGYTLSNPGAIALQESQSFSMADNRHDRFVVCGILGSGDPDVAPRMVQMTTLTAPSASTITLRAFHALAGSPVDVDIHVNGEVITGLGFGEASAPVTFAARAENQDSLVIVPTGETPGTGNDLYATRDSSLFSAGTRCELMIGHRTSGMNNGDVNGQIEISLYSRE
jgi:hypothetical protein